VDDPEFDLRHKQGTFLFSKTPKLALGRTWSPVIWLQGVPLTGARREIAHLRLVPRVRMSVAIPLLPLYALVPYAEKTLNIPFPLVRTVLQALTCAIMCPGFLSQQHGAS